MNDTRFWPRRSHARAWVSLCLGLAALIACGAPERLAVAPTILARPTASATAKRAPIATPRPAAPATATLLPTFTPETPYPSAPPVTSGPTSATPRETPTAPPTQVVTPAAEPPAPALPLDQALAQFSSALLYTNRNGFLILTDGQRELWLTADETSCARTSSYQDPRGEWSPDGQYIAITCQHAGRSIVAILDVQTGMLRRVDTGASDTSPMEAWPAGWSPTGRTFLILTCSGDRSQFSIVDVRTGRVKKRNIFDDESSTLYAAWSPNGTQIAIYTGNGLHASHGSSNLYLVNADGSNLHLLTDVGSFDECGPLEWSDDSRFIFVKINDGSYCVRISTDTGVQEPIVYGRQIPTVVRWSPDGRWYLVKQQPQWLLYRADGTLVRRFTDDPERQVSIAAWMPDSRRILMAVNSISSNTVEVIVADVKGQQTVIATYHDVTTDVLALAPDGNLLAIDVGEQGIALMDSRGQVRTVLDGQLMGWRPSADR